MKNKIPLLASIAGSIFAFSTWAYGHHSIAATYQQDTQVELEGRLVQFVFRNPHSFVHIEVGNPQGQKERWAVEWTGTAALIQRGMDAASLRPGDQLVLTAYPSRAPGEKRALMTSLNRPSDGLSWGKLPGEVVE
jgi:hypothetical protein